MKDEKSGRAVRLLKQYFMIVLGSFCYGMGTTCFIQAARIAAGGVTGMFNVINYIVPIPVGMCVLAANIPLIIIALIKFRHSFAFNSVLGIVLTSVAIDLCGILFSSYLPFTEDMLLSALAGGVLNGAGIGLLMRNGSSSGGTDIIMKLIHLKFRHIKGGVINIVLGLTVCVFYLIVTGNVEGTLYTAIAIVTDGFVFDLVLYGGNDSKTVYIITNNSDEMIQEIFRNTSAGATILDGEGAYTKSERKIILCVVRNSVFPQLKEAVREADDKAFMIVTKSSEVFGEGYEDFSKEIL